jgi:DNA-binding GntR family transcriptional regulator
VSADLEGGPELVRQSSGEQAASYIRRLIFDGVLRPGARVPQDDIAADLGISRIPVREALIALERQGWVTIERHRGAFVTALDPPAVRDHYELYGLVYGFAVRRALERTGPSIVDELAPLVRRMRGDDPAAAGQAILEFHRTVVNAARSSRIRVVLRAMSSLVPGDFFAEVPEAVGIERRGLGAVLRHLRAGDPDGAADAYARTMAQVGEAVVRLFEARGLFAAGPADRGA